MGKQCITRQFCAVEEKQQTNNEYPAFWDVIM